MGNAPTESMQHRFKRLRLSQTEEILRASPLSISPKRKSSMHSDLALKCIDNDVTPNIQEAHSLLVCANNRCLSTNDDLMNGLSIHPLLINNESVAVVKSDIQKDAVINVSPDSDFAPMNKTAIVFSPLEKSIAELSDDEIIECVKYAYIKNGFMNKSK